MPAGGSSELDLITGDLAAKPAVAIAALASVTAGGAVALLSTAGAAESAPPRVDGFISRALAAGRLLVEPVEPADDPDFGGSRVTHAIGTPVPVSGGAATALCAGVTGPAPDAETLWRLDAYARLAALWLDARRRYVGRFAGTGRDELTGCVTYAALLHQLGLELERCRRLSLELSCLFIGLDGYEPAQRNRVLAGAGKAVRAVLDGDDTVGRYGGDEFVVLLPGTELSAAVLLAELIRVAIRTVPGSGAPSVEVSVGAARWIPGSGPDRLLGAADRALAVARSPVGPSVAVAKESRFSR